MVDREQQLRDTYNNIAFGGFLVHELLMPPEFLALSVTEADIRKVVADGVEYDRAGYPTKARFWTWVMCATTVTAGVLGWVGTMTCGHRYSAWADSCGLPALRF